MTPTRWESDLKPSTIKGFESLLSAYGEFWGKGAADQRPGLGAHLVFFTVRAVWALASLYRPLMGSLDPSKMSDARVALSESVQWLDAIAHKWDGMACWYSADDGCMEPVKCTGAAVLALLAYRELQESVSGLPKLRGADALIGGAVAWLQRAMTDVKGDFVPVNARKKATYYIQRKLGWPTVPRSTAEAVVNDTAGTPAAVMRQMGKSSLEHLLNHGFGRLLAFDPASGKEALLAMSSYIVEWNRRPFAAKDLVEGAERGKILQKLAQGVEAFASAFSSEDGWGEYCCDDPFATYALLAAARAMVDPEDIKAAVAVAAEAIPQVPLDEIPDRDPETLDVCTLNSCLCLASLLKPSLTPQYVAALSVWLDTYIAQLDYATCGDDEFRPDYMAWYIVSHLRASQDHLEPAILAQLDSRRTARRSRRDPSDALRRKLRTVTQERDKLRSDAAAHADRSRQRISRIGEHQARIHAISLSILVASAGLSGLIVTLLYALHGSTPEPWEILSLVLSATGLVVGTAGALLKRMRDALQRRLKKRFERCWLPERWDASG